MQTDTRVERAPNPRQRAVGACPDLFPPNIEDANTRALNSLRQAVAPGG